MHEQQTSTAEPISPEQRDMFLAMAQYCTNRLAQHKEEVLPVLGGDSIDLISSEASHRIAIRTGGEHSRYRYKIDVWTEQDKIGYPLVGYPLSVYTLADDSVIRKKVFRTVEEHVDHHDGLRKQVRFVKDDGNVEFRGLDIDAEFGEPISADEGYALIDEATKSRAIV